MKYFALLFISLFFSCKKKENTIVSQNQPTATMTDTSTTFNWQTPLCEHSGIYDPNKFTRKQLDATLKLWSEEFGSPKDRLYVKTRIKNDPEDYFMKDEKELDRQYEEGKEFYKSLDYIHTPFWDKVRRQKMKELDYAYKIMKIETQAYKDPKILLANEYYSYCRKYADILASNDTIALLNAWEELEKQMAPLKSNHNVWKKHKELFHSKDRLVYARIYLMDFGWNNCVVNNNTEVKPDMNYQEEFEKLFVSVKTQCEE